MTGIRGSDLRFRWLQLRSFGQLAGSGGAAYAPKGTPWPSRRRAVGTPWPSGRRAAGGARQATPREVAAAPAHTERVEPPTALHERGWRAPVPRPPAVVRRPAEPPPTVIDGVAHRPPVEPVPDLFGFARHLRGRLGSRLFWLFFLAVYALIVGQLLYALSHP